MDWIAACMNQYYGMQKHWPTKSTGYWKYKDYSDLYEDDPLYQ